MKRRNNVLGDDLDDYYLKGSPDRGPGITVAIIAILIILGVWTGII